MSFLLSSAAWPKDQTLLIHQIRGGLDYRSEVVAKNPTETPDPPFILDGFYEKWKCSAWVDSNKSAVVLTCFKLDTKRPSVESPWKIQDTIQCDSEDSFFLDAVTVKCQGSKPVKFWGK